MKTLSFHIEYYIAGSECVELCYSVDGGSPQHARLQRGSGNDWHAALSLPDGSRHLRHAYRILSGEDGRPLRTERNSWRQCRLDGLADVAFADSWADECLSTIYHTKAFSECLFAPREGECQTSGMSAASCLLTLHALPPCPGRKWAVAGSSKRLGEWDVRKALPLQRTGTYEWTAALGLDDFEQGAEYKYLLVDEAAPANAVWEEGDNRRLPAAACKANTFIIRQDETPRMSVSPWRGAGCVVPVFSLRSEGSFGVGDFGDLVRIVRWASECGMKAVQLLPVNDTTRTGSWRDSYPYNGISVFALHPIYLDARQWRDTAAFAQCEGRGRELNQLAGLDYERTFALKMEFARSLFKEIGKSVTATKDFRQFEAGNKDWLEPYAAFCTLRDLYGTADFRQWPEDVRTYCGEAASNSLPAKEKRNVRFWKFVQYLLHQQMLRVHEKAARRGVLIKGDIPIGISRDSVPAWVDGCLFHFDGQAGAPPDAFAVHGQNWGFPTYNWKEMAKDNYLWWRRRLQHMGLYFDAYRIDHVLGFFRIWEVPTEQLYGILGHFRPALPLSRGEIEAWGFQGDAEVYSRPAVGTERMAELIKQTECPDFASRYFTPAADGTYFLRREYLSQRNIERTVADAKQRAALMDAACEVLFVRDGGRPELFHPRVMPQGTSRFKSLAPSEQEAFNRLHDDFFYVRHNDFWAAEAMKKMPAVTGCAAPTDEAVQLCPLHGAAMLPCAEDLGMVPASVKGVLERLQILSLEIQRMPKAYGMRFGRLEDNPYLSVSTIATHDMPPLRLWWTESREQTQAFWHKALRHEGDSPAQATPQVCEEVVRQHLESPSMLCLLALQDWFAISPETAGRNPAEEQINVPANPDQYWRYRMHLTLEALMSCTGLNEKARSLIALCRG